MMRQKAEGSLKTERIVSNMEGYVQYIVNAFNPYRSILFQTLVCSNMGLTDHVPVFSIFFFLICSIPSFSSLLDGFVKEFTN